MEQKRERERARTRAFRRIEYNREQDAEERRERVVDIERTVGGIGTELGAARGLEVRKELEQSLPDYFLLARPRELIAVAQVTRTPLLRKLRKSDRVREQENENERARGRESREPERR